MSRIASNDRNATTADALKRLFQDELARVELTPDHLHVSTSVGDQWDATLMIGGRRFEMGSTFHDGFFCGEETRFGRVSFIPADARAIFASPSVMVQCGLLLIRSVIDAPRLGDVAPPVI